MNNNDNQTNSSTPTNQAPGKPPLADHRAQLPSGVKNTNVHGNPFQNSVNSIMGDVLTPDVMSAEPSGEGQSQDSQQTQQPQQPQSSAEPKLSLNFDEMLNISSSPRVAQTDVVEPDIFNKEDETKEPQSSDDQDAQGSEDSGEDQEKDSKAPEANLRKLGRKYSETKSALEQRDQEIQTLQERIAKYDKGEEVPQALSDRLSRLQRYEQLVDLKSSEEFHETKIKPLEELKEGLTGYLEDYGMSEDEADKLLSFENQAELNRYLSSKFDATGALEVKVKLAKIRKLQREIEQAEQEPGQALERMIADTRNQREARKQQSREKIKTVAEGSLRKALSKIKEDGKFQELIFREGDEEFNNKWVKPHIEKASKDYAQIIGKLVELGVDDMPEDLAYALSMQSLLTAISATSTESREAALKYANNLSSNVERDAAYYRPHIGGSGTGFSSPAAPKGRDQTLHEGLDGILSDVFKGR